MLKLLPMQPEKLLYTIILAHSTQPEFLSGLDFVSSAQMMLAAAICKW